MVTVIHCGKSQSEQSTLSLTGIESTDCVTKDIFSIMITIYCVTAQFLDCENTIMKILPHSKTIIPEILTHLLLIAFFLESLSGL